MKKYFYWCGIIAALSYITAVIVGGALIPNYSHINQAISEIDPLINHNYKILIVILFGLYNVLALIYGIMQYLLFNNNGTICKIQSLSITIISLAGLSMYFFPMDIVGSEATAVGIIHLVLAGIMAPLTILSCILGFWVFKKNKKMRVYSLITGIIIFICGGTAAFFAANALPGMGLFERITIGSYIIWLFLTSLYYMKNQK